jgi:hypothetical protein
MKSGRIVAGLLCAWLAAALAWRIFSIDFGRIEDAAAATSDEGRAWLAPTLSLLDWKSLPHRSVAYRIERPPQISPTERIVASAIDFAMLPGSLVLAEDDAQCADFDFVLTHRHSQHLQRLADGLGFRKVGESRDVCLLARPDVEYEATVAATQTGMTIRHLRTGLALGVFVGLAVLVALLTNVRRLSAAWAMLFVCVILIVCLSATLPHTLISPNGTAVYAGKAKLFLLGGGFPPGVFIDKTWAVFQPSYPPGLTALVALFYWMSGECGNWLVQAVPFLGVVLSLWFVFCRMRTPVGRLLVLIIVLSSTTCTLCRGFYAEGWMALFLLLGFVRVVSGRDDLFSWMLLGLAACFKNEGFLFYAAMAASLSLCGRWSLCRFSWIMLGLLLPGSWHLYVRYAGGGLDGFDLHEISVFLTQTWKACCLTLRCLFLELDSGLWTIPLAVATPLVQAWRRGRSLVGEEKVGVLFVVISLVLVFCVYGCCESGSFAWHLDSSVRRLLWTPALLALLATGLRRSPASTRTP